MKKTTDLSIIIVNYNTRELLRLCLQSLEKADSDTFLREIIVVDNGSTDESSLMVKKEFPRVRVVRLAKNTGFSFGNNVGIKQSSGRYVLLLNSDTEVEKNVFREMLRFMEGHPDVGAATCRLELPGGMIDPACHRGFPTPWAAFTYFIGLEWLFPRSRFFAHYHQGYKAINTVHEIDSPSGAFFFVRREVIDEVGFLDEDYFMYGEDLDWAYRIKQKGWKIVFNPSVSVLHKKKQSGRSHPDPIVQKRTEQYFYDSMRIFYQKHYAHRYGALATQLVLLGIKCIPTLLRFGHSAELSRSPSASWRRKS